MDGGERSAVSRALELEEEPHAGRHAYRHACRGLLLPVLTPVTRTLLARYSLSWP